VAKSWRIGAKRKVIGTWKWWSARLVYVASPFFRNAGSWSAHSGGSRGIVGAVKDYERKVQTSETLIEVAMIRLLVLRLGRWA
jgi:hypothetical protein